MEKFLSGTTVIVMFYRMRNIMLNQAMILHMEPSILGHKIPKRQSTNADCFLEMRLLDPGPKRNICLKVCSMRGIFEESSCKNAATVEEAIELCLNYSASMFIDHHILLSDSNGKSAIIEWDGSKLNVIRKKQAFQVATNFIISNTECEDSISCKRYLKATELLKTKKVSKDSFRDILEATRQGHALFSQVGDLCKKVIYLYYSRQNYDDDVVIDVIKELQKGKQTVNIPSLFYCAISEQSGLWSLRKAQTVSCFFSYQI